jgi:integrase
MAKRGNSNAHLADSLIRRLPPPAKGNKVYYDGDMPGFGIRVTAGGAKAFVLNYYVAGRERRYTFGSWPTWTATQARKEARRLRRLVDEGGDPLDDVAAERAAPTVADLVDRFEAEHLGRLRPNTAAEYRRLLTKHVRPHFGVHSKVSDVVFSDIDRLHRKITVAGSRYAANRVTAVCSKMFQLAIKWNMRDKNPALGVEKNTEFKRRRYLVDDELARLAKALAAHPDRATANVIRLLLLTGARRGEVLAARWADLDLGTGIWSKPASSTKQKQDHIVPLSAPARQLLSVIREQQTSKHRTLPEFVFPGHGATGHVVEIIRAWRRVCKAAGITGLRIHDLRHSYASQLASGGASLPLIGALLGHSTPNTTARYAHLFIDPQRAATERVGAIIEAAGGQAASAVVSTLKRRPRHGR